MMRRRSPLARLPALLRALRRSTSGVALTEFAFSLPILMSLLLAGLEVSNFALAHLRVNQIAMTVADNAGRVRTTMDESNVYEVFSGADVTGQSIDFNANGRIVLSSLQGNGKTGAQAGQMINWQRCHGSLSINPSYGRQDAGRNDATLATGLGRTGNKIVAAPNTAVMFVEVTYDYQPLISNRLFGPSRIRYESAFNVRERTNQNITNTQSLTVKTCP